MSRKPRQDAILAILKKQGFATVKELCAILHYSTATVYRDLDALEHLHLVKRSYGGVEPAVKSKFPPLPLRYDYMKKEKRYLGRTAASLIGDGDTIFIDASTTGEFIAPFLAEKKGLRVITNNLRLAVTLGEYDIDVIALGGTIVERPYMVAGDVAVEQAMRYRANKVFFSTGALTEDGHIADGGIYDLLHRVMIKNSDKAYFLADRSKLAQSISCELCDFSALAGVICDFSFSEEVTALYPNTEFLCVEK